MSDAEQRAQEREGKTGDRVAETGALASRLRSGEVRRERVLLAAKLGHPEAREVLGLPPERGSARDLHALDPTSRVRVLIGAARALIAESKEQAWRDKQQQALVALEAWALDPDPSRRPVVRDAVQRTRWETNEVDEVTPLLGAANQIVQGFVGTAPLQLTQAVFDAAIREVFAWALGPDDPLQALAAERRERARRAWRQRAFEACGRLLHEPLRPAQRVRWAAGILAACAAHSRPSREVSHVVDLARDPSAWGQAHTAFQSLRQLTIQEAHGGDPQQVALLELAETTAKVIYNASDEPAPFHFHRGWRIPGRAWALGQLARDRALAAALEQLVFVPV